MDIKFAAATDVGRQRAQNEDSLLADPGLGLFVVADGMGGHAAGEVASKMAIEEIARQAAENSECISAYRQHGGAEARHEILTMLEHAVQAACARIHQRGLSEPDKRGMGTTTSALLLIGDRGFIAHVGDSRVYLLRHGQLHQLTEDHSLINELIRRGRVKREDIETSPYARYKNAVTRAVGANESVEIDTLDFDLLGGDQFLICSDGLHQYLQEGDLAKLFENENLERTTEELVALANRSGGQDNITAVTIRVETTEAAKEVARSSDVVSRIEVLRRMPLFRHLSYKEVMRLLNLTLAGTHAAGETIVREGDAGEEMYIILSGQVRLHKGEAEIARLERGAHFGEMALVDRSPRSASATAVVDSRTLVLRRREFFGIIRKEPVLATKLLWSFVQVLSQRLRKTTADLSGARLEADAEDLSSEALFEDPPSHAGKMHRVH